MSLPHTQNGKSYSETSQTVLQLRAVSGPKESIQVHVPFTANGIQKCKKNEEGILRMHINLGLSLRPWH
jgi:hypothetical protein